MSEADATRDMDTGQEGPGESKPSSRPLRRVLLLGLAAIVLLGGMAVAAVYWLEDQMQQPRTFGQQTFPINRGDTLKKFAIRLQQAGVVAETLPLTLYARYRGDASKLHTGFYQFSDGLSLIEVLDAVTSGKYRLQHSFTFVQGSNFGQLREALAADSKIKLTLAEHSDDEVLALFDSEQNYSHPEGLFFPETYAFDPGATDEEILRRAYRMMQATLSELWAQRDPDIEIETPYQALILASIIEKETALESERAKISGVFMNRLRKDMKLQTDPTVIYGLGDEYDGNITRAHLKTDTPYNTYTRKGLPPTPIAMPGRAAIEAALNPEQTEAIYFVAKGDGSGAHTFSRTLEEHNRAVKAYLKNLRKSG